MSAARLTRLYPQAVTDFYGSGELCVYKTGDPWPVAQGPESQNIIRAARPIYDHPIAPKWLETAWNIVSVLDSLQVNLNTVNPLAYANAGEAALICGFVITVGVFPGSLAFDAAVAAAGAVKSILERVGFPEIQVAFVESIYYRYGAGPKLMAFNPNIEMEGLPGLRKHFTPTLSPAIAPLKTPHFEGSGGLYFRLSSDKDDKRVVLLTCAHVSHPPPAFENKVYTRKKESQPREDVILLGSGAFDNAVQSIMGFIGDQTVSITTWEFSLARLPEEVPNEPRSTASRRKELTNLIETAKDKIEEANTLHTYITKNFTTTASRVFGFVLHVAKIEVGADNVLYDWSFIQVDEDKIDWDEFKGNMVFVGKSLVFFSFSSMLMFPFPFLCLCPLSPSLQAVTRPMPTGRTICSLSLTMHVVITRLMISSSRSRASSPSLSSATRRTTTFITSRLSLPSRMDAPPTLPTGALTDSSRSHATTPSTASARTPSSTLFVGTIR
ncbi:hypothetical protein HGRIS_008736 [Hohenbuehelia grisea]|uniref:Uncharacterized protein n=1 Tax=Hohenbuehelia grisea TaxID=104357 RepID=A0ABR3JAD8_9AGAR